MKSIPINQWEEDQLGDETTIGPSTWKSAPPCLLIHWMRRNCVRMIHTYNSYYDLIQEFLVCERDTKPAGEKYYVVIFPQLNLGLPFPLSIQIAWTK